jgi:hypothetical protein
MDNSAQRSRGDEFMRKARKAKVTTVGKLFGFSSEAAADLYEKAANCYKLSEACAWSSLAQLLPR